MSRIRPPLFLLLWLLHTALAVAVVLGVFATIRSRADHCARTQSEASVDAILQALLPECRRRIELGDWPGLETWFRESTRHSDVRLRLIDPSGRIVANSGLAKAASIDLERYPEIARARQTGRREYAQRFDINQQRETICGALPIEVYSAAEESPETEAPRGTFVLAVSLPVGGNGVATWSARGFWTVLLAAIGLATLSAWATATYLRRPLLRVMEAIGRLATGRPHEVSPLDGPAEWRALSEAFNDAVEELERRFAAIHREHDEDRAILTSMIDGILVLDLEGKALRINEACAEALGTTPSQLAGRPLREVVRKPELLELVDHLLKQRTPRQAEIVIHHGNDRYYFAQGTVLHDSQGRPFGVLVVLHDVTRLRYLENVRRDFVSNVSHELRTPITSIKGFIETLLDGAINDRENAVRFLTIVRKQADRLNALMDDLLSLARIERGETENSIRLEPEAVIEVIDSAVQTCQHLAEAKGISLTVSGDESIRAMMNMRLLEQALVNLIDNAIKYSPAETVVAIRFRREGNRVVIEVADQGCGIEQRHLARLFERFYRVDPGRSVQLGGTGLGLAIVKHIAAVHQGDVSVESTVNRGSTFRIALRAPDGQ